MNTLIVLAFEVVAVLLMGWDRHAFQASAPWFAAAVAIAFIGDLVTLFYPTRRP